MIHRAKFQNFKALRDVEITFDSRLTVLVGPNGSGKTSVLQGLETLSLLARGAPPSALAAFVHSEYGGFDSSPQPSMTVEAVASIHGEFYRYSFRALMRESKNRNEREFDADTRLFISDDGKSWHEQNSEGSTPFATTALLRLSPTVLAAPSKLEHLPPQMTTEGAGLASVLAFLDREDRNALGDILAHLRAVIPQLDSVRPAFTTTPEGIKDSLTFRFRGSDNVPSKGASSGTLIVLGLLTGLVVSRSPRVVLLDDIDRDLHPKAQMQLIGVLRKLLVQFPDLQIIATSHSPYILDRLEWSEVWVTSLGDDGATLCKPLTAHPDFERWKDSMSPGEFWGTFYEDWLTKPRNPQPVA